MIELTQVEEQKLLPALVTFCPASFTWEEWPAEKIVEAMRAIGRGPTSKMKRDALAVLAAKLAEVRFEERGLYV